MKELQSIFKAANGNPFFLSKTYLEQQNQQQNLIKKFLCSLVH